MADNVECRRIGVFGGTFDPIHVGHLLVAEIAREKLGLSEMRFVPASLSPLKIEAPATTSDKQRLEMVKLAVGGNPFFLVDDREIQRGGASYTVETLRELQQENEDAELYFLMGADSLEQFHLWREPKVICELARVVVVHRGGYPAPEIGTLAPFLDAPDDLQTLSEKHIVSVPQVEVSSSDLRARIRNGESTRYQLHPAVSAFIGTERLYCETD